MTFREWLRSEIDGHLDRVVRKAVRGELRRAHLATAEDIQDMALDFTQLEQEVSENSDAVESASTLLAALAAEIRAAAGDPDALAALADRLDENTARLAAATAANTPGAPEPEPEPEPEG